MAKPAKPAIPWPLIGLLLATLVIRANALWAQRVNLNQDPDAYREIAENLLRHGEFALGHGENEGEYHPTAYRPPLYPLVLSNLATASGDRLSLPKIASLHLVLGLATVWLTWLLSRRVAALTSSIMCSRLAPRDAASASGAGERHAGNFFPVLAGLLVACDPILLNQQSLVMTETLATFLAVLSLWCLTRFDAQPCWFRAALAGGAIGLAILCRPTFLPWLALLVAAIAAMTVYGRRWQLVHAIFIPLAAAAIIGPWTIRNYRVFGKPIATTTHGGYTLLLGNNSSFYNWLTLDHSGLPWDGGNIVRSNLNWLDRTPYRLLGVYPSSLMWEPKNELEMDAMSYDVARRMIRENPSAFVLACMYRITQLWSPLPHKLTADESLARRLLRYATCVWYLAVYALAAVGVWKLRWNLLKPPWLYGVLLCLAFTAVHTFYWTNLRMRAPLMPFIALIAAAAVVPTTKTQQPTA